jgi:hypothetical protein
LSKCSTHWHLHPCTLEDLAGEGVSGHPEGTGDFWIQDYRQGSRRQHREVRVFEKEGLFEAGEYM